MPTVDRRSRLAALPFWAILLVAVLLGPRASCRLAEAADAPAKAAKKLLIVAQRADYHVLGPFVAHKKKLLPTELVALEDVLKEAKGADDAEKLKRYLYDHWKKHHLGYVLLAGDAGVIPVRYIKGTSPSRDQGEWPYLPSDLYYADLAKQDGSFENWNGRKDGLHADYFGELMGWEGKEEINQDGIDYLPEVAVGRWPVHNHTQLQAVAAKTIKYETHVLADNLPAIRRLAFVNGPNLEDCRVLMSTWADRVGALTGSRPVRLLYKDANGDYKTPPPDMVEVERVLNGGVGMIFHNGHGSETTWDGCLDLARLRSINNTALPPVMFSCGWPVMFSCGCTTGRFAPLPPGDPYVDANGHTHKGSGSGEKFAGPAPPPGNYQRGVSYPRSLGVEFVRSGPNGAVAYIGCAVGAQSYGRHLMDGFVENYLAHEEPRLGDVWEGAVSYYYKAWGLKNIKPKDWSHVAIFVQGMSFHLFGDPSMRLPRAPNRSANLLVNGSFEDGPEVDGFLPLDEGSTAITGWTVIRGQIDYLSTHWQAADGLRSLDLHGSPGYGGVSHSFETVKGRRYRVTFSLSSSGDDPIVKQVGVAAAGKTAEDMGWTRKSWEFEAVADRTTLEIYTLEKTDPVAGPALDDVRVVAVAGKK